MHTGRKGSSCAAAIAFVSAREVHVVASVWGSGSEFSFRFRFSDQGLDARQHTAQRLLGATCAAAVRVTVVLLEFLGFYRVHIMDASDEVDWLQSFRAFGFRVSSLGFR
jgi:hypothetical protein